MTMRFGKVLSKMSPIMNTTSNKYLKANCHNSI